MQNDVTLHWFADSFNLWLTIHLWIVISWSFVTDLDIFWSACVPIGKLLGTTCLAYYLKWIAALDTLFQKRLIISVISDINQFVHLKFYFQICIFTVRYFCQIRCTDSGGCYMFTSQTFHLTGVVDHFTTESEVLTNKFTHLEIGPRERNLDLCFCDLLIFAAI